MPQKPRNFAAMREDRVLAMARDAFGREYRSKKAAIDALSTLSIAKQHALKKPRDPSPRPGKVAAIARAKTSTFANELRGGVAPPSSTKLAEAPAAVVKRYARMTTGLEAKSKAQALTLMAKLGPTDVARAAGGAIGRGGFEKGLSAAPRAAAVPKVKGGSKLAIAAGVAAGVAAMLVGRANAEPKETPQMAEPSKGNPTVVGTIAAAMGAGMMLTAGRSPVGKIFSRVGGPALIAAGAATIMSGNAKAAEPAKSATAPNPVDQSVTNAILNRRIDGRMPAGNEKVMSERIPHMMTPPGYTDRLRSAAFLNDAAKAKAATPAPFAPARTPAAAPAPSSGGTYERTYKSGAKAGITETVQIRAR